MKKILILLSLLVTFRASAQIGIDANGQAISSSSTGAATKVTQVQGADQAVSTVTAMNGMLLSLKSAYMTCYVVATNTVYRLGPDLTTWTADSSYDSRFKASGYAPDWTEITNKPTFFNGDYGSLTNKPTLFSGSYTDLSNKPNLAAYQLIEDQRLSTTDNVAFKSGFFNGYLTVQPTNLGGAGLPVTNSASGARLLIGRNISFGSDEIDYISMPGIAPGSFGGHAFYTNNSNGGTSGGMVLNAFINGQTSDFISYGRLAAYNVDHQLSSPTYYVSYNPVSGALEKRTKSEVALDINATMGGLNNPMTTYADIIIGGLDGAPTRLPQGNPNDVLTVGSEGGISWRPPTYPNNPIAKNTQVFSANGSGGSYTVSASDFLPGTQATLILYINATGGYTINLPSAFSWMGYTVQVHCTSVSGTINVTNTAISGGSTITGQYSVKTYDYHPSGVWFVH